MIVTIFALLLAAPPFQFFDDGSRSLSLTENGAPVFTYNYGRMWQEGVPKDRARCCYLHPVYAPNGAVVTDDFPKDHYHHRGISWMWPIVNMNGLRHDLWILKGIDRRFVRWTEQRAAVDRAVIGMENEWTIGSKVVVREFVSIVVHRRKGASRDIEFALRFEATDKPLELSGAPEEQKGYGGFNIRFAPRQETSIRADGKDVPNDSNHDRHSWAELAGVYQGKPATVRITEDKSNPESPVSWCLRKYGFLGANFPGTGLYTLKPGTPLVLRYRVTVTGG